MLRYCLIVGILLLLPASPYVAYNPGSGDLFSDNFTNALDADWEMGNGFLGNPSPWTINLDGADNALSADGFGPFGSSPSRHWARHYLHPTEATTLSVAFEYETEYGAGYYFFVDVEQRAEALLKYRMRIDENGVVSLWRSESGAMVQMAATGPNMIPRRKKRWIRFAIEPGAMGHTALRMRVWSGGASSEPSTGWTLEVEDDLNVVQRVHRFEIETDGPSGNLTWIDDLDVYGDPGDGVASSVQTIYIVELSHLDIGFTEPPDEVEIFGKTHLDQILNNLAADSEYRWLIESGWWLEKWWERSTAVEQQEMVSWLRNGRLRLAAGYANQTSTMVGHEEMIRNLYYSTALAREHGFPVRTWMQDDVPGSTFAVPEILARSGIDYYLGGMNTGFGGSLTLPDHGDRPFWWVGPDGSKVLSWVTFHSYAEAFRYGFSFFDNIGNLYDKLGRELPAQEEAGYAYPELMLLRGFDNHYQGFHARNLVNQWNAAYATPQFVLSSFEDFMDHMVATYGSESFPEFSGDFGAAWARSRAGTPHTVERIRQAHRAARAAETLAALGSSVDGQPAPTADLEFMYTKMLTSDEHTGAGGWPGYFTPAEMDRNNQIHLEYATDARDTADRLLTDSVDRILMELPAGGNTVAAVNSLGRPRDGWVQIQLPPGIYGTTFKVVEVQSGLEVPFQRLDASSEILFQGENLPGFGYRTYALTSGAPVASPPGMLAVTGTTIENDFYRLTLDPTDGSLSSMVEKSTGRELIDLASPYDFNELAKNTKAQYDAGQVPVAVPPSSATVTIATDGALLAALKVTRTGSAHVQTIYRLYNGEDRVEIENLLDKTLAPYVPLATSTESYMVTMPFDIHNFQIRTETTTRFLDPVADSFQRTSVFDYHNAEHTIALFDSNGGIFYAVDQVSAHHLENLTSLGSSDYSTGDALVLSRLLDRSDEYTFSDDIVRPYVIEPGTPSVLKFTHHIQGTGPTFDPVAASRFGFEALNKTGARLLSRRPGNLPDGAASFLAVDSPAVLPASVKPAMIGSGLVIRLTELTGTPTTARISSAPLTLADPWQVEFDEEGGVPLSMDGNGFLVSLGAYETATVRFQAEPAWAPLALVVGKSPATGTVELSWTGGVAPFTLYRAGDAAFTTGNATLVDEQAVTAHSDPALHDLQTYYYLVK